MDLEFVVFVGMCLVIGVFAIEIRRMIVLRVLREIDVAQLREDLISELGEKTFREIFKNREFYNATLHNIRGVPTIYLGVRESGDEYRLEWKYSHLSIRLFHYDYHGSMYIRGGGFSDRVEVSDDFFDKYFAED